MITRLFCLRHGEPELTNTLLGSTDIPLSPLGLQQMYSNAEYLFNKHTLHYIYSSPLKRCATFAEQCKTRQQLPFAFSDNLRECNFGDWDGQPFQQLWDESPEAVRKFWEDPWQHYPPNAETPADFSQRVILQIEEWVKTHAGQSILLITHAGVIRTLIAWALAMPLEQGAHFRRLEMGYAALNLIEVFISETDGALHPRLIYTNRCMELP